MKQKKELTGVEVEMQDQGEVMGKDNKHQRLWKATQKPTTVESSQQTHTHTRLLLFIMGRGSSIPRHYRLANKNPSVRCGLCAFKVLISERSCRTPKHYRLLPLLMIAMKNPMERLYYQRYQTLQSQGMEKSSWYPQGTDWVAFVVMEGSSQFPEGEREIAVLPSS